MKKLVRDKIPEILIAKGIEIKTRILNDNKEYLSALHDKLVEEVNEFLEASEDTNENRIKEELADMLEIIDAICKHKKYTLKSIEKIKKQKLLDRGGFQEKILLIYKKK